MLPTRRRIVAKLFIVDVIIHCIQTEPVNASLKPEPHRLKQSVYDFGIMEIEIRLLCQEVMHIVLLAPRIELPSRTTKDRKPVVRRCSVRLWVSPDIPICLGVGAA